MKCPKCHGNLGFRTETGYICGDSLCRYEWTGISENRSELAYKCTTCGKWAHAKRKPKYHQRYTGEEPLDSETIIEYDPGDPTTDGGWIVRCGPFDTYEMRRKNDG